jgi:AraC-like DNA-binding protein
MAYASWNLLFLYERFPVLSEKSKIEQPPVMIGAAEIDIPRVREEGIHTQPANEFLLIEKGRGVHRTVHGELPFKRGDIHFFPRGQLHTHVKQSKICKAFTVRFRDESFFGSDPADKEAHDHLLYLKTLAYQGKNKVVLPADIEKKVKSLFRLSARERHHVGGRSFLKGIGLQALSYMMRARAEEDEQAPIDPRIVKVLSHIDLHAAEYLTVDNMAKLACLSRSHFHALFKKFTGDSFVDYLTRIRVGMAALKLSSTDHTVLDVAYECGFYSVSRFYEAFKKFRGHSPGKITYGRRKTTAKK